ncbi:MAG: Signal transduction histidine kinase [Hyphomicrobiales bacterium]|nr:Signal transduction histidine kinase [Hyphomicrobiales bacterium]
MSPAASRWARVFRGGAERSIAQRLFLSAAIWSAVVLVIAGVSLSAVYRGLTERAFDERLGVYLRALVADVAMSGDDAVNAPEQLGEPQFELTRSGWYWQITRVDVPIPLIRSSRSLFAARLPRLADFGMGADSTGVRRGFAPGPDGRDLRMVERVIDMGAEGQWLVQVAATTDDIELQIRGFIRSLAFAFVALGLALVGTTALQVRYGLRPLRRLQDEVAAIRRGDSEGIGGSFPQDLAPLAGELNLLISSNREVMERARTQVGNLAHALKTPLSVISNEANADASPLAEKVREQAALMRDQVTWYLDRARAAARSTMIGAATEVEAPLGALVRTFEKIYRDRDLTFALACAPALRFRGERQDFEEMVGNLVDNAGKWASARVELTAAPASAAGLPDFISIHVDDDGPGLPAGRRAEALGRGRRLDETKPGSGLGLAIVADLAKIYGGSLALEDSPLGGLRAVLRLPAA